MRCFLYNNTPACVYLLFDGGAFKVGFSTNLDRRISVLESQRKCKLSLVDRIEISKLIDMPNAKGAWKIEQNLHRIFRNKRIEGEWYNLGRKELGIFKQHKKIFGDLSVMPSKALLRKFTVGWYQEGVYEVQ